MEFKAYPRSIVVQPKAEALTLRNEDVDLKYGMLFIHQSKFGKSRQVPTSKTCPGMTEGNPRGMPISASAISCPTLTNAMRGSPMTTV